MKTIKKVLKKLGEMIDSLLRGLLGESNPQLVPIPIPVHNRR